VAVDAKDHVWVVHRGMDSLTARTEAGMATDPKTSETCCAAAPRTFSTFDPSGALVSMWGAPGAPATTGRSPRRHPRGRRGSRLDRGTGAPALGGRGVKPAQAPPDDAHVLKFSRTGSSCSRSARRGKPATPSRTRLNRPASIDVDGGEVYVADAGNTASSSSTREG
jgi:hypothetical protein